MRGHPRLARASAKLARVVGKLLEASSSEEMVRVSDLWREIETVASREELRSAIATVDELVPHLDEDEGDVRARLSERIRMVSGFLRELCEVFELGSNAEGEPVPGEMRRMPWLLDHRRKLKAQFHRHLKRRDVYAPRSSRWRDPRAQLLSGEAWE